METIVALLGGGALGAIGTSIFKYLTTRREQTLTNEEKLRDELQEQIDALKEEVHALRTDVDHWREKYFEIYEEHIQLKARLGK
jgi:molybdopterin converting factor small subunit